MNTAGVVTGVNTAGNVGSSQRLDPVDDQNPVQVPEWVRQLIPGLLLLGYGLARGLRSAGRWVAAASLVAGILAAAVFTSTWSL